MYKQDNSLTNHLGMEYILQVIKTGFYTRIPLLEAENLACPAKDFPPSANMHIAHMLASAFRFPACRIFCSFAPHPFPFKDIQEKLSKLHKKDQSNKKLACVENCMFQVVKLGQNSHHNWMNGFHSVNCVDEFCHLGGDYSDTSQNWACIGCSLGYV